MTDNKRMAQTPAAPVLLATDVEQLRNQLHGEVIQPGDASYDEHRLTRNLNYDRHPVLIIRPKDADDVVQAVRFAADAALPLAVKGGGHSGPGFGSVDNGIVIDMSLMRNITVDPQTHITRVEGGSTTGEVTKAVSAHGLIVPFGDSPDVGVGGITLGGGVGWLGRKFGLTIDSLVAAEMVTADGRKLRVSETENSDLFWAIRGGGGNFGIVTTFEFEARPLGTVLGGALYLPATREVIRGALDLSLQAPEELTTISMLMPMPPDPSLPEKLHGNLSFMVMPVWTGDLEAGQHELDKFRALAKPYADSIKPMKFPEIYEMNAGGPLAYTSYARAFIADTVDNAAIDAMIAGFEKDNLPTGAAMTVVQIRVLGGAIARVPAEATAYALRDANWIVAVGAIGFEMPKLAMNQAWVEGLMAAMASSATGAYLNFLDREGEERLRSAYPDATYQRLAQIKRKYDPENLFRLNQNIPPAAN